MDPNETIREALDLAKAGDMVSADMLCEDYCRWTERGGFSAQMGPLLELLDLMERSYYKPGRHPIRFAWDKR